MLVLGLLSGCLRWEVGPAPAVARDLDTLELTRGAVRYVDRGAGDAVVLVHGFGAAIESWGGTVDALARTHRVLALDARGFGLSSRAEGDYTIEALSDDIVEAMDARGIERASVVAHSWGSAVTLALALRHPERVERLVITDGLVFDGQRNWFVRTAQVPVLGEALVGAFWTAQLDLRLEESYADPTVLAFEDVQRVRKMLELRGSRAAGLAVVRTMRLADYSARYGDIDVPTLVIWGDADAITPPAWAERLGRELPNSRVELIEAAGHFPMLEAPARYQALVQEFLS